MGRLESDGVIPPLSEGEEEETRSVDVWAAAQAKKIMDGEYIPKSTGGRALGINAIA